VTRTHNRRSDRFAPWIGESYGARSRFGVAVLVVGESLYGTDYSPDYNTVETVRWFRDRPHRFYTGAALILLGVHTADNLQWSERKEIWDHVAFYNYFQSFVGDTPRVPPTAQQWREAEGPFRTVLDELKPKVVLVLSRRVGYHLVQTEPVLADLEVCLARHPSGRGWSSIAKREIIRDFQDAVRKAGCH